MAGIRWIVGLKEGPCWLDEGGAFPEQEVRYGGYLWSDLFGGEKMPNSVHARLCRDFAAGWDAVGFAVRGNSRVLGPWAVPTTARGHRSAPLGCYLLSPRLCRPCEDPLTTHTDLTDRVTFFCDPVLEVKIPEARDFHYRPPGKPARWAAALSYLIGRGGR